YERTTSQQAADRMCVPISPSCTQAHSAMGAKYLKADFNAKQGAQLREKNIRRQKQCEQQEKQRQKRKSKVNTLPVELEEASLSPQQSKTE
ncbi:MAG: hypothetical protein LQ349_007277, partial [Xanthoria aureola]